MNRRKCCVPKCEDRTSTMHRFPHPVNDIHGRFTGWLELVGDKELASLDKLAVYKNKRVCGRHFSLSQRVEGCGKLKKSALPDLYIPEIPRSLCGLQEGVGLGVESSLSSNASNLDVQADFGYSTPKDIPGLVDAGKDVANSSESTETKYCRLCALECKEAVSIFGQMGVTLELAYKISMILPITVTNSTELPHEICWDCIKQLDNAVKFVNKCVHAQLKIEKIFKSLVQINLNSRPVFFEKSNFQVEPSKSTSSCSSNELLPKEITSKDGPRDEGENTIDLTTTNSPESSNLNDNNKNGLLSSFTQTKDPEDGNSIDGMFEENYADDNCDTDNEVCGADQAMENLEGDSSVPEGDLDKDVDGFSLMELVRYKMKNKTLTGSNFSKQINKDWFWCKYCNKYFLHKTNLDQHQVLTHPDFVEKIFSKSEQERLLALYENSNKKIGSNISHIPHEKKLWIKEILSGKSQKSCESPRSETPVSSAGNEENIWKVEEVSSSKSLLEEVNDAIQNKRVEVVLNKNRVKNRRTRKSVKVIKKSEPFSLLRGLRWKLKKNTCSECKTEYNTSLELRKHYKQYHIPRHPCRFCPRTMPTRKELERHELCHIAGKKHKCRRCPESFNTSGELNQHRIAKHMDNPPFRCKTCSKPYFQEHIYLRHVELHNLGSRFLCEMCGKAFKESSSLFAHRKMYCENPVEKKLSCEFCGRMYYHKSQLKLHVRTHTGEKPYLCSICGKGFRSSGRLKHHQDTHSVSKHACSFCGQLFLRNKSLVAHLKRHVNCSLCYLVFDKNIKEHILHRREFHAADVEEELEKGFGGEKLVEFANGGGKRGDFSKTVVKCEKCTRNFASVFWLQLHQNGGCIDQPIFKCPICEKITRSEDSYRKHMMLHSGNESNQCSHCSETFNTYQDLVKHEKEHKVSKPFSCPECGECFRTSTALSKHLIAHSTGRVYSCKSCDEYFTDRGSFLIHRRKHNVEYKQVSPYPIAIKKSLPKLAQILEIPPYVEKKQSKVSNSMLNEDYIINICQSEESYVGDASHGNVAGEVLVYDSQSIQANYSEIILV